MIKKNIIQFKGTLESVKEIVSFMAEDNEEINKDLHKEYYSYIQYEFCTNIKNEELEIDLLTIDIRASYGSVFQGHMAIGDYLVRLPKETKNGKKCYKFKLFREEEFMILQDIFKKEKFLCG